MRLKLFLLLLLAATLPSMAQTIKLQGSVVDASTGAPVKGAQVTVKSQGLGGNSSQSGEFLIDCASNGNDYVIIECDGYEPVGIDVVLPNAKNYQMGEIKLRPKREEMVANAFATDLSDMIFDESVIEDEEGNSQNVAALTGGQDNIYYNTASYNFGPMYFKYRGYDNLYQNVYLNGVLMNDLIRGRFNFSSLMGMTSRAFRNKTTTVGMDAANFGFGDIGGSVNYNTTTDTYSPGFNGSVAYTNSNYMLRAMLTYSTGLNDKGWAFTVSAIGRWANEGIIEGTFYNSVGLFMSLEKKFNEHNSLTLTAFGGPTQRAAASATYQEAYDLAGTNLYNRNWGYQDGKKRSSAIRESFDPTLMLSYLYKKDNTTVNTSATVRWVNYSSSAFNYYNANNPNPDYYKYLPSYWADNQEMYDLLANEWRTSEYTRQIKWDDLYQANYFNNQLNQGKAENEKVGSSYILENRISDQFVTQFNSYINQRITSRLSLQAGVGLNYTNAKFYKTVRDLLGGEFWLDIDPYSDQIATIDPDVLQNNLDDPNRHVVKGDRFGYDYNIYALQGRAWLQNTLNLPKWEINYGLEMAYTQYQRDGHMRNGRAPLNSLGKSKRATFDDAMLKLGALYKLNGRNFFSAHLMYGSKAPIADVIFVAPRIKNDLVDDLASERIFSGDLSYIWNYRRFRGSITGFYTAVNNATEHFVFYDDNHSTNANFSLTDVKRVYKGVELGAAYKITPSVTATLAATYSKFQYKNNPNGTRSFENGMYADTTQTVYLKNYYVGSTPQTNINLGFDWAAPKQWFFGINATWQGDAYVNVGIPYHETLPELWQQYPNPTDLEAKIAELSEQKKLKDAFTLNLSIGKLIYVNRKVSLNFNLSINNVLNNHNVCTYAYQQSRIDTKNYDVNYYPNRYSYAQGIRIFLNAGVRF